MKLIAFKTRLQRLYGKFIHTIYSIYMCIKYPFLYPRNRFTGLHYNYWPIIDYHRNNYAKAVLAYSIQLDDNPIGYSTYKDTETIKLYNKDLTVKYDHISHRIIIRYNDYDIDTIDMRIFFISTMPQEFKVSLKLTNKNYLTITLYYSLAYCEKYPLNSDACHFYDAVINKPLYYKIKILDWIHDYPLQLFHCIPTYNEYDAMESGWKKAFGKQMLDEIKAELKKFNYLYKYRIFDIKEKYGSLRWEDAGSPVGSNIFKITNKYEQMSYNYCLHCGQPTKYVTRGWTTYICEDCANAPRKDGTKEIDYCDPIINNNEDDNEEVK